MVNKPKGIKYSISVLRNKLYDLDYLLTHAHLLSDEESELKERREYLRLGIRKLEDN